MENSAFLAVEKMRAKLAPLLDAWRAKLHVNLITRIELTEVDTSSNDGYDSYTPGTVSSVPRPVNYLRICVFQKDEFPEIELQSFLDYEIKPNTSDIISHANLLYSALNQNTPTPQMWESASKNIKNID